MGAIDISQIMDPKNGFGYGKIPQIISDCIYKIRLNALQYKQRTVIEHPAMEGNYRDIAKYRDFILRRIASRSDYQTKYARCAVILGIGT
ncbi:hypothetical protein GCM10009078_29380 [Cupriavidus gilardii]